MIKYLNVCHYSIHESRILLLFNGLVQIYFNIAKANLERQQSHVPTTSAASLKRKKMSLNNNKASVIAEEIYFHKTILSLIIITTTKIKSYEM